MGHEARNNPLSIESKLQPFVRDARGRILAEGDEVLLDTGGHPIYYRVVSITPVLDPKAPPNLMRIEVAATTAWNAIRETQNMEFIRVRTAEEAGPSVFKRLPPDEGDQNLNGSDGKVVTP